jgi:hypothetical protein
MKNSQLKCIKNWFKKPQNAATAIICMTLGVILIGTQTDQSWMQASMFTVGQGNEDANIVIQSTGYAEEDRGFTGTITQSSQTGQAAGITDNRFTDDNGNVYEAFAGNGFDEDSNGGTGVLELDVKYQEELPRDQALVSVSNPRGYNTAGSTITTPVTPPSVAYPDEAGTDFSGDWAGYCAKYPGLCNESNDGRVFDAYDAWILIQIFVHGSLVYVTRLETDR